MFSYDWRRVWDFAEPERLPCERHDPKPRDVVDFTCNDTSSSPSSRLIHPSSHPLKSVNILVRVKSDHFTTSLWCASHGHTKRCEFQCHERNGRRCPGLVSRSPCARPGIAAQLHRGLRGYIAKLASAEMQVRTNCSLTPYALDTIKKLNAKKGVLARALRTMQMDRAARHKKECHCRRMGLRTSSFLLSSTNGTRDCRLGTAL